MKRYAELLRLPEQKRLLLASIPADFADWLDYVAIIALIAYGWGEGPLALALLALAFTLPHVLVGPFLASVVDRADLRTSLVLSNLGRGICAAALVFVPDLTTLLVVAVLRGIADTAFTPARQAAIQRLTPTDLLGPANGLHQGINQTSKIVGPALGGLLLTMLPAQVIFGINAALSVVAAAILVGIRLPRVEAAHADEPMLQRLTAGFAEFGRNRSILAVLIFSVTAFFAFFLYDTIIVLLTAGLGYDEAAFGLTITASGLGGLAGAAIAGGLKLERPLLVMALAALVNGATTFAIAAAAFLNLGIPFPLFCLAMVLLGGCTAFMTVPYRTVIQAETPPDRLARVFSAGEALTVAVMMGAPFLGSLMAASFGLPAPFFAGGVLLLVLGTASLIAAFRR